MAKFDVQKVRIRLPMGQPTILQYMQSPEDESTPLSYLDPDLQVNSTPTRDRLVQHRLQVVETAWTDDSTLAIFFYLH